MNKGKLLYLKILYCIGLAFFTYTVIFKESSIYTSIGFFIIGITFLTHFYLLGGNKNQKENWWEDISGFFCIIQGISIHVVYLNPFVYRVFPTIGAILLVCKYFYLKNKSNK